MRHFLLALTLIFSCNLFAKNQNSLKINFILDDDYLATYCIYRVSNGRYVDCSYKEDLDAFKYAVYDQMSDEDWEALFTFENCFYRGEPCDCVHFRALIETITNMAEYQVIRKQTEDYVALCKKRWEESYATCLSFMQGLTGISFDKEFTAYITHPGLANGSSSKPQMIFWGNSERWPHYTVVYLWHEILHDYFDYSGASHAVIQLLADNELRKLLNDVPYPPFEGHPNLIPHMEAYEEDWQTYLRGENKDIYEFLDLMKEKFPDLVEHPQWEWD